MKKLRLVFNLLVIFVLCTQFGSSLAPGYAYAAQSQTASEKAATMLEGMSPSERVGQLFLVSFSGTDTGENTDIYSLIMDYHVGGVIYLRENDNFVDAPDTTATVLSMNRALQRLEWESSKISQNSPDMAEGANQNFIPLFIGITQEGNGAPYDEILSGMSSLPSEMAIGATWDINLAAQVGEVLGRELSILGFNLLLGPSLDVIESPNPGSSGDLGSRAFGGDPYWVSQMGSAFISGLHTGSNNQMIVAAKHFPGHGGSDRSATEEIPTISKSLEQLSLIELPPFFAVTGEATNPDAVTDALYLSPIRYQGFQGNIRATTRPVNFDPQAFTQLMDLEPLASWRENGGIVISDDLGSQAIRKFYDPTETTFNATSITRDAFLAGNDILYVGDFRSLTDETSYVTIVKTINFFVKKYGEDVAFAQRVDEAVLRILTQKFQMYPFFTLPYVLPSENELSFLNTNEQLSFNVAREAATLISPTAQELLTILPDPPGIQDRIVFITDTYQAQQCSSCDPKSVIDKTAMEQAVMRLYGPTGDYQIFGSNLSSYTYLELEKFLNNEWGENFAMPNDLQAATWIVFLGLDLRNTDSSSYALKRLLSERADVLKEKSLVVFSLSAPYYLDATEISKIDAFYALYSKEPAYIDVAARLLFKEASAPGSSPVSVPAIGYNLIMVTSPDPDRTIPLKMTVLKNEGNEEASEATATLTLEANQASPTATPETPLELHVGELLMLDSGPILDNNGNPVPDNTPVNFHFSIVEEGNILTKEETLQTVGGLVHTNYLIENSGSLEIWATSGLPEARSDVIQLTVIGEPGNEGAIVPTQVIEPTATETQSPTATPEQEPTTPAHTKTGAADWVVLMILISVISLTAYQSGSNLINVRWGIRWALCVILGGLGATTYLSLSLPGTTVIMSHAYIWGVLLVVLVGSLLGWGAGWLWWRKVRKG
ncbi:MAG: hypothetical protein JXA19_02635 [Anaerolineales bacterium]|nr:hypothetical protein [Anaerolineales bacterium]